jgi:MYXO-CTERM domain-containing protein
MRRDGPRLAGCTTLLALAGLSVPASAFCRTTTSRIPADYDPSISGCYRPEGSHPLFWRNACVGYDIQQSASKQISYDDAAAEIALAFTRWTSATCATQSHGVGRTSIDVRDLGPVVCGEVQYDNYGGPNQHVIIFRDDEWPYDDTSNTLALTTVTYDPDTGEIYDADMEINTFQYKLSITPEVPQGGYDFLAIVTHEAGHFLGMAHATDTHATMYAHYTPGSEAMRLLTEDDIDGICTIYEPDGTRSVEAPSFPTGSVLETSCDPTPMGGFTTQCMSTGGCSASSVAPDGPAGGASWGGAFAALVVLAGRRKRAR